MMCWIASGFPGSGSKPFNATKKGHVISIVLPECHHKGVGAPLAKEGLKSVLTYYEAESCYLVARVSNTSATNPYQKVGFEIEG